MATLMLKCLINQLIPSMKLMLMSFVTKHMQTSQQLKIVKCLSKLKTTTQLELGILISLNWPITTRQTMKFLNRLLSQVIKFILKACLSNSKVPPSKIQLWSSHWLIILKTPPTHSSSEWNTGHLTVTTLDGKIQELMISDQLIICSLLSHTVLLLKLPFIKVNSCLRWFSILKRSRDELRKLSRKLSCMSL